LALFLLLGGLYKYIFLELRTKEIGFSCQSWAVEAEAKLCVRVQYGQIPAGGFNFKSVLRSSCFSSLADETEFASYQIAPIQVCFIPCACLLGELLSLCDFTHPNSLCLANVTVQARRPVWQL